MSATWYESRTPDTGAAWWAVEHQGHPAFYLRALMAGDFAPSRLPLPRHILTLKGEPVAVDGPCVCGTCGKVPASADLDVIERPTGRRGFLDVFRAGSPRGMAWPPATDPASCWLCSSKRDRATCRVGLDGVGEVGVCERCAAHLEREGR